MNEEINIAGFGGQGVLSMGKTLAYTSGIVEGKHVSWMPSYGPEMRGGTANATVILSDELISSPIINAYDTAILLNQQSLDKFEPMVKPGGLLLYDDNGITRPPARADIVVCRVSAAREAAKMKNTKVFNMIVLGAFLGLKPLVQFENIEKGLLKSLPERHHGLVPLNMLALRRGAEIVVRERAPEVEA